MKRESGWEMRILDGDSKLEHLFVAFQPATNGQGMCEIYSRKHIYQVIGQSKGQKEMG